MVLQINPKKDVEDAYKSNNFFTAFALATTYFEYEANLIFDTLFENRIPLQVLGNWSLKSKIRLLLGLKLIAQDAHDKINKIIRIRNKLLHPINVWKSKERRSLDIFLRYRLSEEEKSLLLSFDDCYAKLMKVHSKILTEESREQ